MQKMLIQKQKSEKSKKRPQTRDQKNKSDINTRLFDIMFVCNDEDQSVEVIESSTIDFNKVIEHLSQGNSVFIAPKSQLNKQSSEKSSSNHRESNLIATYRLVNYDYIGSTSQEL